MRPLRLFGIVAAVGLAALGALVGIDYGGPERVDPGAAAPLRAELHRRIFLGSAPARQLAFSPDGRLFAASSADGTIHVWRALERARPRILSHEGGVTSLAFSRDGLWLASGGYDGKLRLWRAHDGRPVRTIAAHQGTVWSLDVSPDGERIASGGEDKVVRLWRSRDGGLISALPGHRLNVWSLRFSPDGRTLASSSFDHDIRLWDGLSGRPIRILGSHDQAVVGIDISPNGLLLASGGDDSVVRLWRLTDGAPQATLRGPNHVYGVAFSADGKWLAGAGRAHGALRTFWNEVTGLGGPGPAVRLWRVSDHRPLQTLDHRADVWSLAFSPDGRWLATAGENGVLTIWRLHSAASAR